MSRPVIARRKKPKPVVLVSIPRKALDELGWGPATHVSSTATIDGDIIVEPGKGYKLWRDGQLAVRSDLFVEGRVYRASVEGDALLLRRIG